MGRPAAAILTIGLAALALGTCKENGPSGEEPRTIEQPVVRGNVPLAPLSDRIDLAVPTFSSPTEIDNPLNPISQIPSALVLGEVEGKPLRIEITLLPETRLIEWEGQVVETVVSQFVAYSEGRMKEVAIDFYAQADDGAVWYFGEDVFNYSDDGHIADQEGAWLAGRDGPAGMITPADPQVGDVYRSESIPGLVLEESTVESTTETLEGPRGPIHGGFLIDEHHYPGGAERKSFAPGYGEFFTGVKGDFEQTALAVPIDALPGPAPAQLRAISAGAADLYGANPAADWRAASAAVARMAADWASYRDGEVPRLLADQMDTALDALERAVRSREPVGTRLAAIDAAVASLDLQLRHRPPAEIDFARFQLQVAELGIDASAGDVAAVRSDVANLQWIRARVAPTLAGTDVSRIDAHLVKLIGAADDEDLAAAGEAAAHLRDALAELE